MKDKNKNFLWTNIKAQEIQIDCMGLHIHLLVLKELGYFKI